jgi:hypothetical protein
MSTTAERLANIKNRKDSATTFLSQGRWNHPHRMAGIGISGDLFYVIDGRDFTAAGTSATRYDFSLSYASSAAYTRVFEPYFPWQGSTPPSGNPAQGEFLMIQRHASGEWKIDTRFGAATAAVVIGTVNTRVYSRPTTSDPWTEDSSTTTNISHRFGLFLSGGGDPDSGNYSTADAARALVTFNSFHSGTHSSLLPALGALVYRLPHEDAWASETAAFADLFAAHITARNTADGAGHSGTCTLSLNFPT